VIPQEALPQGFGVHVFTAEAPTAQEQWVLCYIDRLYMKYNLINMEDRQIVWDPPKEIDNVAKHHVSFKVAQYIFPIPSA
jgi:hypothetical protein